MSNDPMRIHLSLVSHTNVGKTTLARTLLGRDIGEVADRAHVTETTDDYVLARTPEGCELILWDTPGFGNSVALAKRLEGRANPVGWFLSEVWDRVANKSLWLNQKALKHVKETSSVVLYLVNATELPDSAPYVSAEMQILEWIGKPVIVLLNQMGEPKSPEAEQADVDRWTYAMASYPIVNSVLPMDAFARCWVQEFALFDAIAKALPEELHATFDALQEVWSRKRRAAFSASIQAMAHYIEKLANDREVAESASIRDQLRFLGKRLGLFRNETVNDPICAAQTALTSRAADELCALTDKLIEINSLKGKGVKKELLQRLQSDWKITSAIPLAPAVAAGAISSGIASGVVADLTTGGLTMGLGTLVGMLAGALGGAGLTVAYNHKKEIDGTVITWSEEALKKFLFEAICLYIAVAHFGRGRGNWHENEPPNCLIKTIKSKLEKKSTLDKLNYQSYINEIILDSLYARYTINPTKTTCYLN